MKLWPVKLPMWWPDLSFHLRIWPLLEIRTYCLYQRYDRLTFDIVGLHINLFMWKREPLIHLMFDLYRKEKP